MAYLRARRRKDDWTGFWDDQGSRLQRLQIQQEPLENSNACVLWMSLEQ